MANLLTEKEAAELLNTHYTTLRGWRYNGGGPEYVKVGGRLVRYTQSAIDNYIGQQTYKQHGQPPVNSATG